MLILEIPLKVAAEQSGLSITAIRKRVTKGTMRGRKDGYRWWVNVEDVERLKAGQCLTKIQSRLTHGLSHTPTHRSWAMMKARCYNPRSGSYRHYGGRGIEVCDRWLNSFEAFLKDMGIRPKGTSLDRYPDNDGNYEPGNCRWATQKQQIANRGKR